MRFRKTIRRNVGDCNARRTRSRERTIGVKRFGTFWGGPRADQFSVIYGQFLRMIGGAILTRSLLQVIVDMSADIESQPPRGRKNG